MRIMEHKIDKEKVMQLVEQHVIQRSDPRFAVIDEAAFKSKNLYNAANYEYRQAFIHQGKYLSYSEVQCRMQSHEAYKALPAKVSQQILMVLDRNWKAFREGLAAYYEDPSKFLGRPKPPKYKHKTAGRNILIYTLQALSGGRSRKGIRGIIRPSELPIEVRTRQKHIDQVRIVPRKDFYVVEVVYEQEARQANVDPALCAAIDLGTTNLAAIVSNKPGFRPVLVDGRRVKAWNQWYNKRIAKLQQKFGGRKDRTRQMERITTKRNRRMDYALHTASRRIIDLLEKEGIGTLIIGLNPLWKQESQMNRRNNQNFVQIPHKRFIDMLSYKARLVGIIVEVKEESYTSKASFLDLDPIPVYDPEKQEKPRFSGTREKRGLYRASGKRYLNADVNGAYNILRKHRPDAFAKGVAGYVVHPVRIDRINPTKAVA
jgi:putative transposase